jgi:mRNA interferase MazF
VVSSSFHLALTGGDLVTVLPLTTRERPGWLHRVALKGTGTRETSFVITEQLRTVSASRLSPPAETLDSEQIEEVRRILRKMLDLP